jgi:UDP-glucose/GDP-mannose dehydrogenase family, NAD binding domain
VRTAVIGMGYVGLASGVCFADFGHVVACVDKDAGKISPLRNGVIPIFESGLDDLVAKNAQQARLFFETDAAPAVSSFLQFSDMTINADRVVNRPPVTTASDPSASKGRVVDASSLFSASDVDGKSLLCFFLRQQLSATSARIVQAAGTTFAVMAAQLAQITFTAGTSDFDDLFVNVHDGSAFSGPTEFHVNVVNNAPTVTAPDQTETSGQVLDACRCSRPMMSLL